MPVLNHAGGIFLRRYRAGGGVDDLNRAVDLCRQAVEATPQHSPDLSEYLNNLGAGMRDRFGCMGHEADLDESIRVFQRLVKATPPDSPDLPSRLNILANCLHDRFGRTAPVDSLSSSITVTATFSPSSAMHPPTSWCVSSSLSEHTSQAQRAWLAGRHSG